MANNQNLRTIPPELRHKKQKGEINRSTYAKKVLSMKGALPDDVLKKLKILFPAISNKLTIEEIIYIQQANKAIVKQDTAASEFIVSSAHGKPEQPIKHSGEMEIRNWQIIPKSKDSGKAGDGSK